MTFTPTPHPPYQWHDTPAIDTPLDEAHLEAAETDIIAYVQGQLIALDALIEGSMETPANKDVANGYAGLDAGAKLKTFELPLSVVNTNRIATATSYAMAASDRYVGVTDTTAVRTITLPLAASLAAGMPVMVKDESGVAGTGTAGVGHSIAIAANGTDHIDGLVTYSITRNGGWAVLVSDGASGWRIVSTLEDWRTSKIITLEEIDPLCGTAGHACDTAWATATAWASIVGSSGYARATLRLRPSTKYEFASPPVVPSASLGGVHLEGLPRSTTIYAQASFNAGINGANHFLKNWTDADYTNTEKIANPTTYAAVPPSAVGTSQGFYGQVSGLNIDTSAVPGLNGLGWSSPQETTRFEKLIFHGATGGANGGAIPIDIGGALNGAVIIDDVVCYGADNVYFSEIRCRPTSGSDIHISNWTTAPAKHGGSVFDIAAIDVTLDNIHSEAYVDPVVAGGPAIFNLQCIGVSLSESAVFLTNHPGLNHPVIQMINPHGSGFGYASPRIAGLEVFVSGTTSFNVPYIQDHAQTGHFHDITYVNEGFVSLYDGNIYSGYLSTGQPFFYCFTMTPISLTGTGSGNITIPKGAGHALITCVGGSGGGGGAGSAAVAQLQTGGAGGTAGTYSTQLVALGSNTTLAYSIGHGGTGGGGGAAGGNPGVAAGSNGTLTTVTGTGIAVTGTGGGGGGNTTASSTTAANPSVYGGAGAGARTGTIFASTGAPSGGIAGDPFGYSGGGGGGGGAATATNGGAGASAGSASSHGSAGASGGSGTSAGTNGADAAAGSLGGGGGGGGGAAGTGAGGNGGKGDDGGIFIKWLP